MSELVRQVTITVSANAPKFVFVAELNDYALEEMRSERVLGFKFQKNKYKFLNELAEALAQEFVEKFQSMESNK